MTDRINRTWGYSSQGSQIFNLKEGESLPDGWVDSPAKVSAKAVDVVAIPDGWAEKSPGSHFKRIGLAKKLAPDLADDIKSDADAIAVIEAHLDDQDT